MRFTEQAVESVTVAHSLDGPVLLTNCDKITPGMLMGAMQLNIPTLVVTAGPMLTGRHHGQKLTASANDEIIQLKSTIASLRNELEHMQIIHEDKFQKMEQNARDEVNQLQEIIRALRVRLEAREKDQ